MTASPLTAAPTTDTTAVGALSDFLFGDFRAHRPWAELSTDPDFSHRSALSATEQIGLAYANYQHAYGPATLGQPDGQAQTPGGQAA